MVVDDLRALPPVKELAIVINAGTRDVATLALLSTLRYANVPSVLIDCEIHGGSLQWFESLSQRYPFLLMSAPLRQHGETLDWIFRNIQAERVLLVDSDAELLAAEMVERMREMLDKSSHAYGSGYLHPAGWLQTHYGTDLPLTQGIGYYKPRPWIPFALLRTAETRLALEAGRSFLHRLVLNDVSAAPIISKILWHRFHFGFFRKHRIAWLDPLRRSYEGKKPAYIVYDTGADIHEYLSFQRYEFASVETAAVPWSVTHLGGVTRGVISGASHDSRGLAAANDIAVDRLKKLYGMDVDKL